MLLVDTSIWVDHLRYGVPDLKAELRRNAVTCHPYIIGEISLGSLAERKAILEFLGNLPAAPQARHIDIMHMIESRGLYSRGIGYVDAALLASALLAPGTRLWTQDKRLSAIAEELGIGR